METHSRKVEKRLSEWRAKMMLFGRRLTLVKSVLGSLPLYYFSMFCVPVCVIEKLECIRQKYFLVGLGKDQVCLGSNGIQFYLLIGRGRGC